MKELIFSTPIYTFNVDKNLCDWTFEVLDANRQNNVGKYNRFSWKSDDIFHKHPQLEDLTKIILERLTEVYKDYKVNLENKKVSINAMWGQISKEYDYHSSHIHPNSYFSGILYLKTPPFSGHTIFYNKIIHDNMIRFELDGLTPENCGNWKIEPEQGKLIIFPSWIPHFVTPSWNEEGYGGEERSTLAFTSILEGSHTEHTMKINLSCNND